VIGILRILSRRFQRAPILERKKWWSKVPTKHGHTYRRLPLEHCGAANKVGDIVIIRCHDRTFPLKLKMFLPVNRAQKSFAATDSKEETATWETAKAVADVREALLNLADITAELWPYDDTPRILQRILHNYNFGAAFRCSEQEKVKVMVEFCDGILRENACRAVEKEPPLSFREAKERWVDTTERLSLGGVQLGGQHNQHNLPPPVKGNRGGTAAGLSRGGFGGGGQLPRGGTAIRGRSARFMSGGVSFAVCFAYNRGQCSRPTKGCGCEDGRGGIFAHACNYFDNTTSKYCLQNHPRDGNH